jgi:hypothetical protein
MSASIVRATNAARRLTRSPANCLSHHKSYHIYPPPWPATPRRRFASYHLLPLRDMTVGVAEITIPASGKKISVQTGLFINNKFVPSVDSQEKLECVILCFTLAQKFGRLSWPCMQLLQSSHRRDYRISCRRLVHVSIYDFVPFSGRCSRQIAIEP